MNLGAEAFQSGPYKHSSLIRRPTQNHLMLLCLKVQPPPCPGTLQGWSEPVGSVHRNLVFPGSPGIWTGISSGFIGMSDAAVVCEDYGEFGDWVALDQQEEREASLTFMLEKLDHKRSEQTDEINVEHRNMAVTCNTRPLSYWSFRYRGLWKAYWCWCMSFRRNLVDW